MISSRIALRLALGILCGVALVALPAVFSAGTPTANYPSTLGSQRTFNPSLQPLYGLSNPGAGELSFLVIIVLIFLPSVIFSLVVRRWAEKRAREYL
ncbi:MAG TPA: hypothetical protein VNA15_04025 [Candidatus Angelobacter sp.]|nr:hypothetical protein [Candidatus Angelobacter sp.]